MTQTIRRVTFALISFLLLGGSLGAYPGGTFTITGGTQSTTQFDVVVSAADAQGNRTLSVADNGAIMGSRIVSVTPNSHTVRKDEDCVLFRFKVKTGNGETYDVEFSACSGVLTNRDKGDQVGSFKPTGGTTDVPLFG